MFLNIKSKRIFTPEQKQLRRERRKPFLHGRWHKIYPKPGRTEFKTGDLVLFKQEKLKAYIQQQIPTRWKHILLYQIRCIPCGVELSVFGNELLLLKRASKPVLKLPQQNLPIQTTPTHKLKPCLSIFKNRTKWPKNTLARLTYWPGDWDARWCFINYNKTNINEAEKDYWRMIQDKKPYRIPADLISIEWSPHYLKQLEGKDSDKNRRNVLSTQKGSNHRRPKSKHRKVVGVSTQKRKATKSSRSTSQTKPRGN